MKSGGEPSSSLKHKFSKRLHGLLGRWAPSFLVRESENSVCVWSAEDTSVGFGWLPVTKVNIWARSPRVNDLVYGRVKDCVCTCTQKRACLLTLAGVPLQQMIKHFFFFLHILDLSCWCIGTLSGTDNLVQKTCHSSAAKWAGDNSVLIHTATTSNNLYITKLLLFNAELMCQETSGINRIKCESNTESTAKQDSWDIKDYSQKFVLDFLIRSKGIITWLPLWPCIVWLNFECIFSVFA